MWLLERTDQSALGFDAAGKLKYVDDRYGNRTTLSYDPTSGKLTSVTDPANRGSLTLGYDPTSGLLTSVSDWASPARVVRYEYSSGRLWKVTDREGKTTTLGYDGTSTRLTSITDANTHTAVTMTYDAQGRVATQKDAKGLATGQQTSLAYATNADGTTTTTVTYPATSFDGNWTFKVEETYDLQGRLVKRLSKPTSAPAEWITEEYGYDSSRNRVWAKDGRGNTTTFCYDVDYSGAAIATSHGNLTRRIDPPPTVGANRPVTLFQYDGKNNLVQTISPKGVNSGTTVDCTTNLSASLNLLYATDLAYDTATQTKLESVTRRYTDPEQGQQSAVTTFTYDANHPGLVSKVIPPRGNASQTPGDYASTFTYYSNGDAGKRAGLLQSTTGPLLDDGTHAATSYDYDSLGRRTSMVDPNGNAAGGVPADHTWQYTYDNEDRLRFAKAPPPASGGSQLVTEFTYDAVGNREVAIDANGQVTKYVYDQRDSLQEVQQSPAPWTWPNRAQPLPTPPASVVRTTYSYDNQGLRFVLLK
ncbi:MAG: RHS repeat protein [Chloroflexi bacterium]|nr:RHS repeat protein [Chloroflexota bacterium]